MTKEKSAFEKKEGSNVIANLEARGALDKPMDLTEMIEAIGAATGGGTEAVLSGDWKVAKALTKQEKEKILAGEHLNKKAIIASGSKSQIGGVLRTVALRTGEYFESGHGGQLMSWDGRFTTYSH